jgi:hypothetical protein
VTKAQTLQKRLSKLEKILPKESMERLAKLVAEEVASELSYVEPSKDTEAPLSNTNPLSTRLCLLERNCGLYLREHTCRLRV